MFIVSTFYPERSVRLRRLKQFLEVVLHFCHCSSFFCALHKKMMNSDKNVKPPLRRARRRRAHELEREESEGDRRPTLSEWKKELQRGYDAGTASDREGARLMYIGKIVGAWRF